MFHKNKNMFLLFLLPLVSSSYLTAAAKAKAKVSALFQESVEREAGGRHCSVFFERLESPGFANIFFFNEPYNKGLREIFLFMGVLKQIQERAKGLLELLGGYVL